MLKKTIVALSVATLATGAAVLPTAAAKGCNPCAAKACNPCNPCKPKSD